MSTHSFGCSQPMCSHPGRLRPGRTTCDRDCVTHKAPVTAGPFLQVRGPRPGGSRADSDDHGRANGIQNTGAELLLSLLQPRRATD